ncbi:MAG TPA: PEP-CTERM sorting domain-containing protein [Steroidobacteraceae bacterium]|jgi:hypothetical protein|nr:PEP-CTERM sorting domain-containing protein [Steroidobacteraceae bacterium]
MFKHIKKLGGSIAAVGLLLGYAASASAAYVNYSWEDTLTWQGKKLSETTGGYGYYHDISESTDPDAYNPAKDYIDSAWVRIWLTDDEDRAAEAADIDISPYLLGWGLGGGGSFDFDYASNNFKVSFFGLLDLRDDGTLGVYITPKDGDFYLTKSLLHADGQRYVAVPEPGSVALLSIGLIGIGLALSRRRSLQK